jgi:hypothetical protein
MIVRHSSETCLSRAATYAPTRTVAAAPTTALQIPENGGWGKRIGTLIPVTRAARRLERSLLCFDDVPPDIEDAIEQWKMAKRYVREASLPKGGV